MAKPEWGIKHECPNCSIRFYDMLKPSPITCPSCGYEFATDVLHRIRKTKPTIDDSDEDLEISEDDLIEDIEDEEDEDIENTIVDDGSDLLLHDDEDDSDGIGHDTSDVSNLDDNMFPDEDEDDQSVDEELPDNLLSDEDLVSDDDPEKDI